MRGLIKSFKDLSSYSRPRTVEGLQVMEETHLREQADNYKDINPKSEDDIKNDLEKQFKLNQQQTVSKEISGAKRIFNNDLVIVCLDSKGGEERLPIQYMPTELAFSRTPKYAEIEIIGRNTPQYHYTSGVTQLTLQLDFHAEQENRDDVIKKCRWLEHLAYNDGYNKKPKNVVLIWGDLFINHVNYNLWIVKNVSYKLSQFQSGYLDANNSIQQLSYLPNQAYVSLTLEVDAKDNLLWDDIRKNDKNILM